MRITLDIDEALLEAVRTKLGVKTRTEAIDASLREVLERGRPRPPCASPPPAISRPASAPSRGSATV
jgi:hypothetical protein